jgi:hypothetical protein
MFNPGSEFFPSRIPDLHLNILPKKIVSKAVGNMIRVVHPGPGSLFFYPSRIPDPGVKMVKKIPDPDPQHCIILCMGLKNII